MKFESRSVTLQVSPRRISEKLNKKTAVAEILMQFSISFLKIPQ